MKTIVELNNTSALQARIKLLVDAGGHRLEYKHLKWAFLFLKVLTPMGECEILDWMEKKILELPVKSPKIKELFKAEVDKEVYANEVKIFD